MMARRHWYLVRFLEAPIQLPFCTFCLPCLHLLADVWQNHLHKVNRRKIPQEFSLLLAEGGRFDFLAMPNGTRIHSGRGRPIFPQRRGGMEMNGELEAPTRSQVSGLDCSGKPLFWETLKNTATCLCHYCVSFLSTLSCTYFEYEWSCLNSQISSNQMIQMSVGWIKRQYLEFGMDQIDSNTVADTCR